jgi:hypothetical protein
MGTNNNLSLINNPLRFPPLHQSRALYKSALFMQNKPNFNKHQNNRKYGYSKGLQKYSTLWTRPKQTQSNPISNLLFASLTPSIPFFQLPFSRSLQNFNLSKNILHNRCKKKIMTADLVKLRILMD